MQFNSERLAPETQNLQKPEPLREYTALRCLQLRCQFRDLCQNIFHAAMAQGKGEVLGFRVGDFKRGQAFLAWGLNYLSPGAGLWWTTLNTWDP